MARLWNRSAEVRMETGQWCGLTREESLQTVYTARGEE